MAIRYEEEKPSDIRYEPDDEGYFGDDTTSSYLPHFPAGLNLTMGLMSLGFPRSEQQDLVKNLPSAAMGQQPNVLESLARGAGQYLPFAQGAAEAIPLEAGYKSLPFLSRLLSKRALGQDLLGSNVYNLTENQDPLSMGNLVGANVAAPATRVAGQLVGKAAHEGSKLLFGDPSSSVKNALLDYILRASQRGAANTPEQTMQNVVMNYTNPDKSMMPVDIGTVAGHTPTATAYNIFSKFPFSGGSEKKNIVKNMQAERDIFHAQNALDEAEKSAKSVADQAKLLTGESEQESQQALQNYQSALMQHNDNLAKMNEHLNTVSKQQDELEKEINKAPNIINDLIKNVPEDVQVDDYISKGVSTLYKDVKSRGSNLFKEINPDDVKITDYNPKVEFPNYANAVSELNDIKGNLTEMFGNDSDMPAMVKSELKKADKFLGNVTEEPENVEYGVGVRKENQLHVDEAIEHAKKLGQLAAASQNSGKENLARMMWNLKKSFTDDMDSMLRKNGHEQIADKWKEANNYWSNHVAPFWGTVNLRRVVGRGTTDKSYIAKNDSLANELYNPNNRTVFNKLPPEVKDAAYYQLITGGEGLSKNVKLKPSAIFNRANKLSQSANAIFKSHNPEVSDYLMSLDDTISTHKSLGKTKAKLETAIGKQKPPLEPKPKSDLYAENINRELAKVEKAREGVQKAQDKRFAVKGNSDPNVNLLRDALVTIGAGAGGVLLGGKSIAIPGAYGAIQSARQAEKLLSNPDLLDAYMKNYRFYGKARFGEDLGKNIAKYLMTQKELSNGT